MTDDFELEGEGEMEPMSSVTFSTSLRQVWDTHRRTGEHLCVYKAYTFFFKWAIVWLDKTLIHRLVWCIAFEVALQWWKNIYNPAQNTLENVMDLMVIMRVVLVLMETTMVSAGMWWIPLVGC